MGNPICIIGPTAAGKTDLALKLTKYIDCEIISIDSAMIYRGMDIGTAKPTKEEQNLVPHHLIDILDASETYSAANFYRDTHKLIVDIMSRGKTPLLVGGTMMYFNIIINGLSDLPHADSLVRNKIDALVQENGLEYLHNELKKIDIAAAKRISSNDPQRLKRAIEVYMLTGKSISFLQKAQKEILPFKFFNIALMPSDRTQLHEKIKIRFMQMLKNGFIDEVERFFYREDINASMPSMRAVGYRQIYEYLAGTTTFNLMHEAAIAATRQLAKRQMTWLRSFANINIFAAEKNNLLDMVLLLISAKTKQ